MWTSSLEGRLGAGEQIVARNLRPGVHVITVTGTNSLGLSGSDSVSITVVPGRRRLP